VPAAAPQRVPLISICVPTHQGRRSTLVALLESVLGQASEVAGQVEVCVSDNASTDGTADAVAEISRRAPCPVVYKRQSTDMGLAPNLLAAVELARGRYCWLLGSDDLLAEGALIRVNELLGRVPGATGYVVGAVHVDADRPSLRSRALSRAFHPPGEETRLIEGIDPIFDECGNAWCALSWSLVDRERWLGAARFNVERIFSNPVFPQVVVLAAMAAERPVWGWLAEPLVLQRNATTFLFEVDRVSLADRWSRIISSVAAAWAAVLGGRATRHWRRRMRLLQKVWGGAEDMRGTKLYDRPKLRSQALLAKACLGAYWPVGAYWRYVLPATLAPVWLTRARYGPDGRWPARTPHIEQGHLSLSAELPGRLSAGSVAWIEVDLFNEANRVIPSAGPNAVLLGQRWVAADGQTVGREQLGLNELAALPQSMPRSLRPRRAMKAAVVLYAPREPGVYRLELGAVQHGRGWLADIGVAPPVARDVEIINPD
jgi:glycosyltransferase involved in cell wall biosynthesis